MKHSKLLIVFALLGVLIISPIAAIAHEGESEEDHQAHLSEIARETAQEKKDAAEARVAEKRLAKDEKSVERRLKACERNLLKINNRIDRASSQATRHKATIDKVFDRVQSFYDSGQLTDPNYEELLVAALDAQNTAELDVATLSELTVDINCEDPEQALIDIKSYSSSLTPTKDSLKAYRSAVVDVIKSLRNAAAETNANANTDEAQTNEDEAQN